MHKHVCTVALLVLASLLAGCRDRHEPTKPTVTATVNASAALPA